MILGSFNKNLSFVPVLTKISQKITRTLRRNLFAFLCLSAAGTKMFRTNAVEKNERSHVLFFLTFAIFETTFRRNLLSPSSLLKCVRKRRCTSNGLHGVVSHKI
jgi:hypothetical protein